MADKDTAQYWADKIKNVKDSKYYQRWLKKAKQVVSRFGGKPFNPNEKTANITLEEIDEVGGYNLLFRNVKIRLPYLLPYIPSVVVERQNKDQDNPAKYAAMMLERMANAAVRELDLNRVLNSTKLYAELFGMSTPWLRYVQKMGMREIEIVDEMTGEVAVGQEEFVESENIEIDLVNPYDLYFDPQKTVEEIKWIARRVRMTRADFKKKFGDADEQDYSFSESVMDVEDEDEKPVKSKESSDKRAPQDNDVCEIFEIWDKKSRKIYFYCPTSQNGNDKLLGIEDYPCDIDFPCPLPLMYDVYPQTIYTPSRHAQFLVQYKQVDDMTKTMGQIVPTLWLVGVYAKELGGLDKAFSKQNANGMVGITIPDSLMAKYPNAKLNDFYVIFDRNAQANMLATLYDMREKTINDIQRGLGIIGLMEGNTSVQEAAATNKIKGSFGTLWVQEDQKRVAEWVVSLFNLYLTMAAQLFEPATIIEKSTIYEIDDYRDYLNQVEQAQMAIAQGQPVQLPENPFDAAIALIKDNYQRQIRLDIATEDTKAYVDAEYRAQLAELQSNFMENLTAFGGIAESNPEFAPLFKSLMMQNVRANRVGKQFEEEIEKGLDFAIESIQRKAAQPPQQPQPDPTVVAAAQIEAQAKVQTAQISAQSRENIEAAKIQAGVAKDGNRVITDAQIKAGELQVKRDALAEKADKDAGDLGIKQQIVDLKARELDIEAALSIAKGLNNGGNFDADLGIS